MIAKLEDARPGVFQKLFGGDDMKKQIGGDEAPKKTGRPESRWTDLDEYAVALMTLEDAVKKLKEGVEFLAKNDVPAIFVAADTMLHKTIPNVNTFCRDFNNSLGALLHAHLVKKPTNRQRNRAKYEQQREKKKDGDKPQGK